MMTGMTVITDGILDLVGRWLAGQLPVELVPFVDGREQTAPAGLVRAAAVLDGKEFTNRWTVNGHDRLGTHKLVFGVAFRAGGPAEFFLGDRPGGTWEQLAPGDTLTAPAQVWPPMLHGGYFGCPDCGIDI